MAVALKSKVKKTKDETFINCFKEDCKTLLYSFSEIENGNYQDFAQLWKDKDFGLCTFLPFKHMNKISSFNRECLEVAKNLFLAKHIKYLRIAALYLLYTIYDRQSIRCGNRINVNINEYKLFTDIIVELYDQGHEEAKYIFLLLEEDSAFNYCLCGDLKTEIDEAKTNEDTVNSVSSKLDATILNKVMMVHLKETVDNYKEDKIEFNKLQKTELSDTMKTSFETMDKHLGAITSFFIDSKPGKSSATNTSIEYVNDVSNRAILKKKAMAIKSDPKHTVSTAYPAKSDEISDSPVDKKKTVSKHHVKNRRWRGSVANMIEVYDSSSDEEESNVVELNLDVLNMSDLIDKDVICSESCELESMTSSSGLEEAHGVKTEIESQDVNMSE